MRRLLAVLAASLLVVSLATACGSSSLSKSAFVAKGDRICRDFNTGSGKLKTPTSQSELSAYLGQVLDLAANTRDDLAALRPPSNGKQVQRDLLAALDHSIDVAQQAEAAAAKSDLDALSSLMKDLDQAGKSAHASVASYGFKVCA